MAVDGYLNFDTQIDTKGFNQGTQKVNNGISGMKSAFGKLGKVIGATFAVSSLVNFGKQAVSMASDLQEVQNVVDVSFGSMSSKMEEFADKSIEMYGISELTAKQTGSTYMAMAKGMSIADDAASDMAISLTGLSADMASFYNESQDVTATALNSVFTGETETLKKFGIIMTEANLQQFAYTQGINKKVSAMSQAEKVMLRYNYVMSQTALAQGDFARTSDGWANQTRILSEQWKEFSGIIGQVLVQVILPAVRVLNQAMSGLIAAAESVKNALAEIFGWEFEESKSAASGIENMNTALSDSVANQEDLTDAVNETSEAYKSQLMSFDKINKLSDNSSESDGSGGFDALFSGDLGSTYEAQLTTDTSQAKKEVSEFVTWFEISIATVKNWWNTNFVDTFSNIWDGLKRESGEFSETLKGVFDDVFSLGDSISSYFSGDFTSLLQAAFSVAGNIVVGLFDTCNTVFSDIWNDAAFPMLTSFIEQGLPMVTQYVDEAIETYGVLFDEAKQIFDTLWTDAVKPVLELVSSLWDDLMQSLSDAWKKWGKPIFDGVREAIKNTGDTFRNIWNNILKPIWDNLMDTVDEVWSEHLKPFVDKFLDFVGTIVDGALQIYNKFISPLIQWFSKTFGPAIAWVFNYIVDFIGRFLGECIDFAGIILDVFKGIIDFVVGIFTGDWERAWNGIKNVLIFIWDMIVSAVKIPINLIINLINGLICAIQNGLNWIIGGLNSLSFSLPDWLGGQTFGLNIGYVNIPQIPYLAQGMVVPANYGEFLAVLGDNRKDTEVVSPLSTIKQAVAEVIGSGGNEQQVIVLNLDGEVVFKKMIEKTKRYKQAMGVNPLGV